MSAAITPWTRAILQHLADGEWHDWEEVIRVAVKVVPPEKAYRRGERMRNRADKRPHGPGPRVRGDTTDSITAGRRSIVRAVLQGLVRMGRVEQEGEVQNGARRQEAVRVRITNRGRETLHSQ